MLQRQRSVSILILVIGFFLLYFIFWDFFGETFSAYQAFQKANSERQSAQTLVAKTPDFKKQFEDLSNRAKIASQAVPGNFDDSLYIVTLANIVLKSGLIMNSIAVNPPNDKGAITLSADVIGSISSYERLLGVVEKALPIFEVTQVSFKSKKELQSFSLGLETYVNTVSLRVEGETSAGLSSRLQAIHDALQVNVQGLQDDALKLLRVNGDIPVNVPDISTTGRDDPFDAF